MVGGNVDHVIHTHRRDLYTAARPSRRNCLMKTWCDMVCLACAESLRRAGLSAAAETLVGKYRHRGAGLSVNISKTVQDRYIYNGRLIGNRIWPIKWQKRQWPWMTWKVIHRLQAFSNAICRTFMQHFTRFRLTVCSRYLCVSGASCMNRETGKRIVYARNTDSG